MPQWLCRIRFFVSEHLSPDLINLLIYLFVSLISFISCDMLWRKTRPLFRSQIRPVLDGLLLPFDSSSCISTISYPLSLTTTSLRTQLAMKQQSEKTTSEYTSELSTRKLRNVRVWTIQKNITHPESAVISTIQLHVKPSCYKIQN